MKSADAFRTISEVSDLLETPAHVLRFWESRFTQIKPIKRAGGRRYYRPGDVALLAGIKQLLHDDGLTIRGVQKILRERGVAHVSGLSPQTVMDAVGLAPHATAQPLPDEVLADELLAVDLPGDELPVGGSSMRQEPGAEDDEDFTGAADAAARQVLPLWAASGAPEAAAADAHLVPDPEEAGAPMQADVPTLPARGHGMVTAIGRVHGRSPDGTAAPAPTPAPDTAPVIAAPEIEAVFGNADEPAGLGAPATEVVETAAAEPDASIGLIDDEPLPAARMLRAMTALRARDHRGELAAIYDRALRLHDRLSQDADLPPAAG